MTVSLRFLILVVAALSTACASAQAPSRTDAPYLLVLGTAQDGGLPQIGCAQECCLRARRDPDARRLVTSLLLVDPRDGRRWLFDATPDLPKQVERARGHGGPAEDAPGRPPLFDGIFLTHAHLGHYAGLLHLGREAYGSQPTNLFGTSHMLNYLKSNGPWSLLFEGEHLSGRQLDPGGSVKLADDITVTAWQVPHRDEFTDTVAFVIRGPNKTALYLPDIDKWEQWDRDLEDALREVDLAFLDGSFFGPGELPGR
ncbi:MAG: MBL fold metallo-hydrolase, partial [Planctomycetota bacterium]